MNPFEYLKDKTISGTKVRDSIDPHKEMGIKFAPGSEQQVFLKKGMRNPEEYILLGKDVTIYIR